MWGEEMKNAFVSLKQALMKAPTLAYPMPNIPYQLQLATTGKGLSAVLTQDAGNGPKPAAYGSRVLSNVEQPYTACEKEVLALTWAHSHWEYIIRMSPVVLKTAHTLIKYVLSG